MYLIILSQFSLSRNCFFYCVFVLLFFVLTFDIFGHHQQLKPAPESRDWEWGIYMLPTAILPPAPAPTTHRLALPMVFPTH